jgi:glycogen debranching enzyme
LSAEIDTAPAHIPEKVGTGEPRMPFRLFALKQGDTYVVADAFGDILGVGDGLFRNDTRILSRFRLTLGGATPSLLGAAVGEDNVFFTSNLANRPLLPLGGQSTPEGVIHLQRKRFLWDDKLYERLHLFNYGDHDAEVPLEIEFGSDFYDIFEVRGMTRKHRGRSLPPALADRGVVLGYEGLDKVVRHAVIAFSAPPKRLTAGRAEFALLVPKRGGAQLFLELGAQVDEQPSRDRFRAAAARARFNMRSRRRRGAGLISSGRLFNDWIRKSRADLALLTTELETGPYPYAGIPWFSTQFGRDAIITALETLWLDPTLARGVLRFLARTQAHETSQFRASAPGKIMHETRRGEMTALGEVPFGQYYGGVDTTPLFVMLACAYAQRTGDMRLIDELWLALTAAVAWIEGPGDSDGDGFVDYSNASPTGLSNQAWKDSSDSIFHADGRFPAGPIAVVEVQGYAYAALKGMAELAARRGDDALAKGWQRGAQALRARVEERFWMEDERFYGLAIDGDGSLCRVRGSNAGHLLYAGLVRDDRAACVTETLLSAAFNSGWGVRTLAFTEARFNPMSYHNGSVWPHDTAVCAAGMARYGEREGVVRLLGELFEAAVRFDMRLPELYCGFTRFAGEPPIAYPVACLPQAWSAGAIFMALQAALGISIDGWRSELKIDRPHLPIGIDQLTISCLSVGETLVDVSFRREAGGGTVSYTKIVS